MPGLGHVDPGGPELTQKLSSEITVSKISVGGMDNNAYLIDTGSGALLIDAADDAERILDLVGDRTVGTIVTTHRHGDHWQALPAVAEARVPSSSVAGPISTPSPAAPGSRTCWGCGTATRSPSAT